ncbi:MAG: ABC transporter substrate-binding protein, partial [Proteobacteria bacterium]|nr:ABC transporter substrate-binding protein [Pseudomonadota bacterium]
MLNRRRILSVIVGVVFVFALPGEGKSATELEGRAERFVRSLAQEAVESLTTKGISHEVRIKRFRKMFNENFAVRAIGKFVLGRHWARATDAEREEYLFLFEDLMVGSYVDRFQRYTGEKLRIRRNLPERTNAGSGFT